MLKKLLFIILISYFSFLPRKSFASCDFKIAKYLDNLDNPNFIKEIDIPIFKKKKIVANRQKEYGDYQYNFTILAELFTLILAPNLKKKLKPHQVGQIMMTLKLFRSTEGYKADNYHDLSIYNDMTFDLHKKDIDKRDKND